MSLSDVPPDAYRERRQESVPPYVTWPMVAFRLVKDLPVMLMVIGITIVIFAFVQKNPGAFGEALFALISGYLGAAHIRTKPAEDK